MEHGGVTVPRLSLKMRKLQLCVIEGKVELTYRAYMPSSGRHTAEMWKV